MQGATPLHLAALRMDSLLPSAAADVVRCLTPSTAAAATLAARAAAACTPVGAPSATPLEAACASSQLAQAAIEALVAHGAVVSGAAGARALLLCLAAGRRKKARLLLQHQVRC